MRLCTKIVALAFIAFPWARAADLEPSLQIPAPIMQDANVVPLFVIEFASRLGIEVPPSCSRTTIADYVQTEASRIGGEEITKRAREARDPWAGGSYFVLKQMENTLVVSRRFVLSDHVRFVELYITIGTSGEYKIVYGEGAQSGGL